LGLSEGCLDDLLGGLADDLLEFGAEDSSFGHLGDVVILAIEISSSCIRQCNEA